MVPNMSSDPHLTRLNSPPTSQIFKKFFIEGGIMDRRTFLTMAAASGFAGCIGTDETTGAWDADPSEVRDKGETVSHQELIWEVEALTGRAIHVAYAIVMEAGSAEDDTVIIARMSDSPEAGALPRQSILVIYEGDTDVERGDELELWGVYDGLSEADPSPGEQATIGDEIVVGDDVEVPDDGLPTIVATEYEYLEE